MSRLWRNDTLTPDPDRLQCSVCTFQGVPLEFEPLERADPVLVISGTVYVAVDVALVDRRTYDDIRPPGRCPFCGTNDPLSGRRGDL